MNKVYMAVTKDKYELPVAVADSAKELARMRGISKSMLMKLITNAERNHTKSIYQVVEIEGD